MALGGRTKSTAPEAIALRGMPSNFADCGASANVMPPAALIAFSPSAPSDAVPERITPIARLLYRGPAACYAHLGRLGEAREVINRLRVHDGPR